MKKRGYFLLVAIALFGCQKVTQKPLELVTLQIHDRHGSHETISDEERLSRYKEVDFLSPQPYRQILALYEREKGGATGKLISYHENGLPAKSLELVCGRASGLYREWHSNGTLCLEVLVLEGAADFSPLAMSGWLFDGSSRVFDESGALKASFTYEKGKLQGEGLHYHSNGAIARREFWKDGMREGAVEFFDPEGTLLERLVYSHDELHGVVEKFHGALYKEHFDRGKLAFGDYQDPKSERRWQVRKGHGFRPEFSCDTLAKEVEIRGGVPEGEIRLYDPFGSLKSSYFHIDGEKEGEEIVYFPGDGQLKQLSIPWHKGQITGLVRSYYREGRLESERSFREGARHGLHTAWYPGGELMMVEEYREGLLWQGKYYHRGHREPLTRICEGQGIATLFDPQSGHPLQEIAYNRGVPS